jgi:hypothetical protein
VTDPKHDGEIRCNVSTEQLFKAVTLSSLEALFNTKSKFVHEAMNGVHEGEYVASFRSLSS